MIALDSLLAPARIDPKDRGLLEDERAGQISLFMMRALHKAADLNFDPHNRDLVSSDAATKTEDLPICLEIMGKFANDCLAEMRFGTPRINNIMHKFSRTCTVMGTFSSLPIGKNHEPIIPTIAEITCASKEIPGFQATYLELRKGFSYSEGNYHLNVPGNTGDLPAVWENAYSWSRATRLFSLVMFNAFCSAIREEPENPNEDRKLYRLASWLKAISLVTDQDLFDPTREDIDPLKYLRAATPEVIREEEACEAILLKPQLIAKIIDDPDFLINVNSHYKFITENPGIKFIFRALLNPQAESYIEATQEFNKIVRLPKSKLQALSEIFTLNTEEVKGCLDFLLDREEDLENLNALLSRKIDFKVGLNALREIHTEGSSAASLKPLFEAHLADRSKHPHLRLVLSNLVTFTEESPEDLDNLINKTTEAAILKELLGLKKDGQASKARALVELAKHPQTDEKSLKNICGKLREISRDLLPEELGSIIQLDPAKALEKISTIADTLSNKAEEKDTEETVRDPHIWKYDYATAALDKLLKNPKFAKYYDIFTRKGKEKIDTVLKELYKTGVIGREIIKDPELAIKFLTDISSSPQSLLRFYSLYTAMLDSRETFSEQQISWLFKNSQIEK